MKYIIEYMRNENFRLVAEEWVGDVRGKTGRGPIRYVGNWVGTGGVAFVDIAYRNEEGEVLHTERVYAQSDRHVGGILPCERAFTLVDLGPTELIRTWNQ